MNFVIDLARPSDAAWMAQLSRDVVEVNLPWSWRPGRLLKAIRNPDCAVIVARHEGRPLGFAAAAFDLRKVHVSLLAVFPHAQLQGVGTQLMHWLEASAYTAGCSQFALEVRAENFAGHAFYEGLGFQFERRLENYYGRREDAFRMTKFLYVDAPLDSVAPMAQVLQQLSGMSKPRD